MKGYMLVTPYLLDGMYKMPGQLRWHEKVRAKLAYWLFQSIPKPYNMTITITTGTANYKDS